MVAPSNKVTDVTQNSDYAACPFCTSTEQDNMVCCDRCESWYHSRCAGVTKDELAALDDEEEEFLCVTCEEAEEDAKLPPFYLEDETSENCPSANLPLVGRRIAHLFDETDWYAGEVVATIENPNPRGHWKVRYATVYPGFRKKWPHDLYSEDYGIHWVLLSPPRDEEVPETTALDCPNCDKPKMKVNEGDVEAKSKEDGLVVGLEEDMQCCVCLELMYPLRAIPCALTKLGVCGHIFHSECLRSCSSQWKNICPLCRKHYSARRQLPVAPSSPSSTNEARKEEHGEVKETVGVKKRAAEASLQQAVSSKKKKVAKVAAAKAPAKKISLGNMSKAVKVDAAYIHRIGDRAQVEWNSDLYWATVTGMQLSSGHLNVEYDDTSVETDIELSRIRLTKKAGRQLESIYNVSSHSAGGQPCQC